jgi:ABC-type sugar transport system substrate-binding protein
VRTGEKPKGKVAVETTFLTAIDQKNWIAYMKERLDLYPGIQLLETKPTNGDQSLAIQLTNNLLLGNPDLRGVWALSVDALTSCAETISRSSRDGQVRVIGLGTPAATAQFVHSGKISAVVLWDVPELGQLIIYVGEALAKGQLKPGAVEFSSPLGTRRIDGDMITVGRPIVLPRRILSSINSEETRNADRGLRNADRGIGNTGYGIRDGECGGGIGKLGI